MSYGIIGTGQTIKKQALGAFDNLARLEQQRQIANENMKQAERQQRNSMIGMGAGYAAQKYGVPAAKEWWASRGAVEGGFVSPNGGMSAMSQGANAGAAQSEAVRTTAGNVKGMFSPGSGLAKGANAGAEVGGKVLADTTVATSAPGAVGGTGAAAAPGAVAGTSTAAGTAAGTTAATTGAAAGTTAAGAAGAAGTTAAAGAAGTAGAAGAAGAAAGTTAATTAAGTTAAAAGGAGAAGGATASAGVLGAMGPVGWMALAGLLVYSIFD